MKWEKKKTHILAVHWTGENIIGKGNDTLPAWGCSIASYQRTVANKKFWELLEEKGTGKKHK